MISLTQIVRRGACRKCPRCGKGNLFASYLKPVDHCGVCGERLGHIRADDGPAWLTIMLVGHILAPFMLLWVPQLSWPEWMIVTVALCVTLVMSLLVLPRAKGVFIGLIWRLQT